MTMTMTMTINRNRAMTEQTAEPQDHTPHAEDEPCEVCEALRRWHNVEA